MAPMEGVTDIVFRQVVAKAGRPDIFFTEFTNVSSYAHERGRVNALGRLNFLPEEVPIVAQIWGVNAEHFEITAEGVKGLGYEAVDINMGCPDKHVVANGGGAGLIRTPKLAAEIIGATKRSGLEVSVKTRLGYTKAAEWREWLGFLLRQDLAALTVHLRTKKEMSKVDAHVELVPEIVILRNEIAPQTKLIINGDIRDIEDGKKYIKMGADGIMIGRGVFADPFCFAQEQSTANQEEDSEGLKCQRLALMKYHLDMFDQYKIMKFEPLKRFFKIYINNFTGAAEVRERLMDCTNSDEVRDILKTLENKK